MYKGLAFVGMFLIGGWAALMSLIVTYRVVVWSWLAELLRFSAGVVLMEEIAVLVLVGMWGVLLAPGLGAAFISTGLRHWRVEGPEKTARDVVRHGVDAFFWALEDYGLSRPLSTLFVLLVFGCVGVVIGLEMGWPGSLAPLFLFGWLFGGALLLFSWMDGGGSRW